MVVIQGSHQSPSDTTSHHVTSRHVSCSRFSPELLGKKLTVAVAAWAGEALVNGSCSTRTQCSMLMTTMMNITSRSLLQPIISQLQPAAFYYISSTACHRCCGWGCTRWPRRRCALLTSLQCLPRYSGHRFTLPTLLRPSLHTARVTQAIASHCPRYSGHYITMHTLLRTLFYSS